MQVKDYLKSEYGFPSWDGYQLWSMNQETEDSDSSDEGLVRSMISKAQRHWMLQNVVKDTTLNAVAKNNEIRGMLEDWMVEEGWEER